MNSPKGYLVTLTPAEIEAATEQGKARYTNARACKFGHGASGFQPHGATEDIHARGAELAVAKWLGVFPDVWDLQQEIAHRHDGDVAGYEVRHTQLERGCLIFRPSEDKDERVYILVVGTMPNFRIVGWMHGRDTKQKCWWIAPNGRPGAYFVRQHALHEIEDLIEQHLRAGQ